MKLQKIIDMVHSFGMWQDESCYKTKCEFYKGSIYVYNHYTWDIERDICHDTVSIDIDKTGKFGRLNSVDITSINKIMIENYPEIFDKKYYEEYLINLDINVKTTFNPDDYEKYGDLRGNNR